MNRSIVAGIAAYVCVIGLLALAALVVPSAGAQTPTATPTPTVTPTATPTVTPTATDTATPTPTGSCFGKEQTYTNGTGQTASDLHARVSRVLTAVCVQMNAPGCPEPSITLNPPPFPGTFDVDWGVDCVDPGESLTVRWFPAEADSTCHNWSIFGTVIGFDCRFPTPTPTAPPTPTITPHGLSDARAKKISAAGSVVLSGGTPDVKNLVVQVRNDGDHNESIGIYGDIVPPGGITNPYGCAPIGRIIDTVITLGTTQQTNQTSVTATLSFDCADVAGALNQTYTIMAVADAHADDGGACGPFHLQSMTCFNALADDDNDATDNRATTNGFRVK